jgi:hypothetical protein
MRIFVPLLMLCAGCRSIAPCHHQVNKPLEVGVIFNYNLPNGQGTVQMEVRK